MFIHRNGGPDKIVPTGCDCVVNYNTFYKKYFIGWTDQKDITAGSYFYYIPSDIEKEIARLGFNKQAQSYKSAGNFEVIKA